jgi:GDPmannose 4,6-dehydratase
MRRKAIVVGSAGQDGRLLYKLLESHDYQVIGLTRSETQTNLNEFATLRVDITNSQEVHKLVEQFLPEEIYFLAAYHHSSESLMPDTEQLFSESFKINTLSLVGFLEAISRAAPNTRLFYAASSLIFGASDASMQDENTSINPDTVYGITKAAGLFACRYYRHNHGVFVSVGILYNHESSFRDSRFVSKKIAEGVARIRKGLESKLVLGDLDAVADWGYAPDYVDAMHRILATEKPDDFVIATGESHTVRDFVQIAFNYIGLNYTTCVATDPALIQRRSPRLIGNPAKLKKVTGWKPTVNFETMVRKLVQTELDKIDG